MTHQWGTSYLVIMFFENLWSFFNLFHFHFLLVFVLCSTSPPSGNQVDGLPLVLQFLLNERAYDRGLLTQSLSKVSCFTVVLLCHPTMTDLDEKCKLGLQNKLYCRGVVRSKSTPQLITVTYMLFRVVEILLIVTNIPQDIKKVVYNTKWWIIHIRSQCFLVFSLWC